MALAMRCSSCRVVVPNNLAACPHCGERVGRPKPAVRQPPSSWELDLDRLLDATEAEAAPASPRESDDGRVRRIEAAQAQARRIVERAETEAATLRLQAHKDAAAEVERATARATDDAGLGGG